MVNRYGFYVVFGYNQTTGMLYPLINVWINNLYYQAGISIPMGNTFGGLDLYGFKGRDVAGIWNQTTTPPFLTIVGFY